MKKNVCRSGSNTCFALTKPLLIMKFLMLFILITAMHARANLYSQNVSMNVQKTEVKKILTYFEKSARVRFLYNYELKALKTKVDYSVENISLQDALNKLFINTGLTYKVLDNNLVVIMSDAYKDYAAITITGKITGENYEPLAGVSIRIRGTNNGTTTDAKGNFTITADENAVLQISYVGFITQEILVNKQSSISVKLVSSISKLDEVVVIGYGTARKKDVVGAIDVISAKDAGNTASTNPSQLLIGKSAGVQVVQTNGTPGADAQILIRGTGSFTNVDPLYVIDGIQGDKNQFNALTTQDIENITILKDASSTAIYGSAAANGVVIITTKKGKSGPPRISFTSQWGISSAWKQLKMMNAAQYIDLLKDFAATNNTALPAKFNTPGVLVDSNNWQKNIFQQGLASENDINITGGSDKVIYNLSLGYITQKSIIKDLDFHRINSRISLDENIGRFHLGQSMTIRYSHTTGQMANITDAISYAPYKPVHDPNILGGYSIESNIEDFSNAPNPLQAFNLNHQVSNEFAFFPQVFGEVSLIPGLKFRSQFQMEIGGNRNSNYAFPYTQSNYLSSPRQSTLSYGNYSFYTLENYFSYNKTFGKHGITATIGNSYIDAGNSASLAATGTNIPNDNIRNISAAQSQAVTGVGYGYGTAASVISYYGRVGYSYDEKYIISGSFRRDGASNFGENNKFGNFYGAGFAWRFSQEEFMKTQTFLSDGKLRIGIGRTGNNKIPTVGITSVLTFSGSPNGNLVYSLGSQETFTAGTTIATLANPDIKWETTDQTDAGIDLAFLNNKLSISIDYYNRKSTGLLVNVPLAASIGANLNGAQAFKVENAADAVNKGLEVMVGYRTAISKDLSFNVNANISYNKNNVLSLGNQNAVPIQAGSFSQLSTFTYTTKGSPIGSFYGYKMDHVAKDQAEIDALNQAAAKKTGNPNAVYQTGLLPGDFIYKDINGSGTVTDSDQAILGNPIPKFIYGFSAGLNYKNFDMNFVFSGVGGLKLLNALKFTTDAEVTGHNATTDLLNRWRKPGDVAALPRAGQSANASGNYRASDWWLESGNYLRLRNLTIGYTFPQSIINSIGAHVFTRIRFYIAAQNLLTITKYSGYDPEVSTQSGGYYLFNRGIDDGQIPQPRTFLAGVQLGF